MFQGIPGQIAGFDLSTVRLSQRTRLDDLTPVAQDKVKEGIPADSRASDEAHAAELTLLDPANQPAAVLPEPVPDHDAGAGADRPAPTEPGRPSPSRRRPAPATPTPAHHAGRSAVADRYRRTADPAVRMPAPTE